MPSRVTLSENETLGHLTIIPGRILGRLTLRAKLTSAFVAVAVTAAFIGFMGWNGLNAAKADFDQVAGVHLLRR